jgi:hypothetical protein
MRKTQWRKFKEDIIARPEYRQGLAAYAIRQVTEKGERPVRVVMIAQFDSVPLPGQGVSKTTRKLLLDKKVPASLSKAQK